MTTDIIIARVQRIEELVRDRRFELALVLTRGLEEDLEAVPVEGIQDCAPIQDLVQASRLFTESLIRLRDLRVH